MGEPLQDRLPDEGETGTDHGSRVEEILCEIELGDGYKLDEVLNRWKDEGLEVTRCRDKRGLSLYTTAIENGFLDIINALLKHDVHLGDALIRCVEESFNEASMVISRYLSTRPELCEVAINATSDNGDFHPALTPIILASQKNNYEVVKVLVGLGATITEPKMSIGAEVTLTQAVSTIHIYRALSQPAYMMSSTEVDIFGYAFRMSKKLREWGDAWEDFGAEFRAMGDHVDHFAADLLGQSASTEEVLALFRYHKDDSYRNAEGQQHPLAKVSEAIMYQQKDFIAHPHTQKVLISHFYRNLLSWNAKGALNSFLTALLVIFFYPIICLTYILLPVQPVTRFVRIPYIMMLLNFASLLTFIGLIVALGVTGRASNPTFSEALRLTILIWNIGSFWLHIQFIWKRGGNRFIQNSIKIQDAIVVTLYLTIFCLQWDWNLQISPNVVVDQARVRRAAENTTYLTLNETLELQHHVSSSLDSMGQRLTTSVRGQVDSIIMQTLSGLSCTYQHPPTEPVATRQSLIDILPDHFQQLLTMDAYDPVLVSEALYGVAMVVSILRLTNLFLVSETLGPLRISLGGMGGDFSKFLTIFSIVWMAFTLGITHTYVTVGHTEKLICINKGGDEESCSNTIVYGSFIGTLQALYWTLFGYTNPITLELSNKNYLSEGVGTFLFASYIVVAVVILLNALIGMLSNSYNIVEEHADTEWKFHRAAVWEAYINPVVTLPPPFNLIPTVKNLFRLLQSLVGIWVKSARRVRKSVKRSHSQGELADYTRVIKLIGSRYIQKKLSSEADTLNVVSPRDLRHLRNDILSVRYLIKNRLKDANSSLRDAQNSCTVVGEKLEELDPVYIRADGVNSDSTELKDLSEEIREAIEALKLGIDRLSGLQGQSQMRPAPDAAARAPAPAAAARAQTPAAAARAPALEPEDEETDVVRRIASLLEEGNAWGEDIALRLELTAAANRVNSRVRHGQPRE